MSTRKIIAAAASVAIMASTIVVFQTSSHPRIGAVPRATSMQVDSRPIKVLEPITVYASQLPPATVGALDASADEAHAGFSLPSLQGNSLFAGSQLFMPYYSFASNLHSMIKE